MIRTVSVGAAGAAATLILLAALTACGNPQAPMVDTGAHADAARQSHPASATSAGVVHRPDRSVAAKPRAAASPASNSAAAVPAPSRPCTASDLAITPAQRQVTDGVQVERFTVTARTAAGCTVTGVPNLVPKGPLSAEVPGATVDLALSQQQFPDDLDIAPPRTTTIPLASGKTASFYLAWFDASSVVCVHSTGFGLNAPGDTTYADLQGVAYPIGAICDGVFYVSAVF
ncbi:hypothetical protein KDK95_22285 [Actinospica sp. MGRD01-02]|uniref:DUF4232 domain-containing protein n=1 Tax=Actinospica acidithermotolerans TaxID=2828514 RepID=A0A941ED08_9ACTN|nr:hypothetical protein [Actinospica acidithermotolerans]MBR7829052.1 hypothetical protein [Actinospica acidithermotolerans]